MVLHSLQVWEQRGHTLVDDDGVGGVVSRETHPDGGEIRNRFQKHLEVLVGRFALPTPGRGQALAGQQKRGHMFCQVVQRRQRFRKWAQELADVITCCYATLCGHGVHDLHLSEHVRREVRKICPENVRDSCADVGQKSSGEVAAGEGEIGMPGCHDAVNVNHSRSGIVCVSGGRTAAHRRQAAGDTPLVGRQRHQRGW